MVEHKYLVAYVLRLYLERDFAVVTHCGSLLLKFVERIDAVLCLVCACLRLTAHPFKFCAQQIACTRSLCRKVLQAFLALLQEIAVIAFVAINLLVINLDNLIADIVKEIAVMGYHEQAAAKAREILLEPLHHFKVEVVGRLVENHELWLVNEHRCQRHALLLTTGKFLDGLVKAVQLQFRQHLLCTCLIIPRIETVHLLHKVLQRRVVTALKRRLVSCNDASPFAIALQTGLNHSERRVKIGFLLKITDSHTTTQGNLATVEWLLAGYNLQQRTLTLSIARNESDALTLLNGKRDIIEKHKVTKTLGHILYLQVYCHKFLILPAKIINYAFMDKSPINA